MRPLGTVLSLIALFVLPAAVPAQEEDKPEAVWEGFRVCNRSDHDDVQVAKALVTGAENEAGQQIIVSEGWWNLKRGRCMMLWSGPIKYRYYLVYAQARASGREWAGDNWVCVSSKPFTIREPLCREGYNRRRFEEVDTGDEERQFTYNLK